MAPPLIPIIAALKRQYGTPKPPRITDPWLMIVHENAAYLVDDERRDEVFESLKRRIGLKPAEILAADPQRIAGAIERGGMQPQRRAQKLIDAAEIVMEDFDGDLGPVLALPEAKARKALRRFPGIGDPSADRILLFTRTHQVLPLDSNGLRALLRLGFGKESSNYAASYRSAQAAVAPLPGDFDWLIAAHQLLRHHGQTLCRRSEPLCGACALRAGCAFAAPKAARKRPARSG